MEASVSISYRWWQKLPCQRKEAGELPSLSIMNKALPSKRTSRKHTRAGIWAQSSNCKPTFALNLVWKRNTTATILRAGTTVLQAYIPSGEVVDIAGIWRLSQPGAKASTFWLSKQSSGPSRRPSSTDVGEIIGMSGIEANRFAWFPTIGISGFE